MNRLQTDWSGALLCHKVIAGLFIRSRRTSVRRSSAANSSAFAPRHDGKQEPYLCKPEQAHRSSSAEPSGRPELLQPKVLHTR